MKISTSLTLVLVLLGSSVKAATKAEANAEQRKMEDIMAQQEDAAEQKLPMDKRPESIFSGILALYDAPASGDVLGNFVTKSGQLFLIKVTRSEIIPDLKKFDQKTITLVGKARVKGKYLLVEAVNAPQPGPTRDRRGKRSGS